MYENNKTHLDDIALEFLGNKICYNEFFKNVEKTVKASRNKGIKQGDIVTMAMATTPEMVYMLYALNRIGACVNAVNPILKTNDIINKAKSSNSKMIIGLDFVCNNLMDKKDKIDNIDIVSVSPLVSAPYLIKLNHGKSLLKMGQNIMEL